MYIFTVNVMILFRKFFNQEKRQTFLKLEDNSAAQFSTEYGTVKPFALLLHTACKTSKSSTAALLPLISQCIPDPMGL